MNLVQCPKCQSNNPQSAHFCNECGSELNTPTPQSHQTAAKSERRQATVLFCDISAFTTLAEKLDPEEVKDILVRFFKTASKIIARYGGTDEKKIGDEVMAVFGVPTAHEDDAARAIRAAMEIQEKVKEISALIPQSNIDRLITHSGINTGLVVTSGSEKAMGNVLVVGDTVNVAKRLCSLAAPGEILVGGMTQNLAERYFTFQQLPPVELKGKTKTSPCHRLVAPRDRAIKTHRFSGRRAALVGRTKELTRLKRVEERIASSGVSAIFVCGEAGTGKSRLIEEYRKLNRPNTILWSEGHAHDYAHGIPYHPIVDLLGREWGIQGGDPLDRVRTTIESRLRELIDDPSESIPYVVSLYALEHPELIGVSPEYWKRKLFASMVAVFDAMAKRGPSVFFFEDLHWADPSTLELLSHLIGTVSVPAIFLCTCRPPFRALRPLHENETSNRIAAEPTIEEIMLEPLAQGETTELTRGLLDEDMAPEELLAFIHRKAEGNPFYVEEVLNSLIEDGVLEYQDDHWRLTKPLAQFDVPPTVEGVIAARLDRQQPESRRVLQEASVIGRTFLRLILEKITEFPSVIEDRLSALVSSDLIRKIALEPDISYIFKHALTQEVAYNSLLRTDRASIHGKVANVIEGLLGERLPEFFETLAFHFKQGQNVDKAADYLIKSGEKAVNRFALEEAQDHFKQAYDLLEASEGTPKEQELQALLLEKWATVFYYYGDFRDILKLFGKHETLIQSMTNKGRRGMLKAWEGTALFFRNRPEEAYRSLRQALVLAEGVKDERVIAYACTWLAMVCGGLGRFEEGISLGERAQNISPKMPDDHYLHFKSLGMMGFNYVMMGEPVKAHEVATKLIEFGKRNPRSLFFGYWMRAEGHALEGNATAAMEAAEQGLGVLKDPFYLGFARAVYGMKCMAVGKPASSLDQALEQALTQGNDFMVNWWSGFIGLGKVLQGHPSEGMQMIDKASRACLENRDLPFHHVNEFLKAKVYLQMALAGRPPAKEWLRHLSFYVQNHPFAERRAELLLKKVVQYERQIGARGWLAQALVDLGVLHQAKNRLQEARACWTEAADLFEKIGAKDFLIEVQKMLKPLQEQSGTSAASVNR